MPKRSSIVLCWRGLVKCIAGKRHSSAFRCCVISSNAVAFYQPSYLDGLPPNNAFQPTPLRVERDRADFMCYHVLQALPTYVAARLNASVGRFPLHRCLALVLT